MKNDKNENKALSQTSVSGSVVDIVAFQNIKTGSIDWRGNHDLATIYSNEYYLAKPNLWKPIYKKTI